MPRKQAKKGKKKAPKKWTKKGAKGEKIEEWVVQRVLDRRIEPDGTFSYLTKWKDYPWNWNTWEPLSSLGKVMWMVEIVNQILSGDVPKPRWRISYEREKAKHIAKQLREKENPTPKPAKRKRGRAPKAAAPKSPAPVKSASVKSAPVASPAYQRLASAPSPNSAASPVVAMSGMTTRSGTTYCFCRHIPSPRKGLPIAITGASEREEGVVPIVQAGPKSPAPSGPDSRRDRDEAEHRDNAEHREELLRGIDHDDDDGHEELLSNPGSDGHEMEDVDVEEIEHVEHQAALTMPSHRSPSAISNGPSPRGHSYVEPAETAVTTHRQHFPSIADGPSSSGMREPPRVDPTMVSRSVSPVGSPVQPALPKKVKPVGTKRKMVGIPSMHSARLYHSTEFTSSDSDYSEVEERRPKKVKKPTRRRVPGPNDFPVAVESEDEEERELRASGRRVIVNKASYDFRHPRRAVIQETETLGVYFNKFCRVGPNCDESLFSALPDKIEGLRLSQLFQSVLQRLIECSLDQRALMNAVIAGIREFEDEPRDYPTVTAAFGWGRCTRVLYLGAPVTTNEANLKISAILQEAGICWNAIRFRRSRPCDRCPPISDVIPN